MSSESPGHDLPAATQSSGCDLPAVTQLRAHQAEALQALRAARDAGRSRAWVVLPPGAGKTRLGISWAQELNQPTVVLSPNTAIQQQWVAAWDQLDPRPASRRVGDALASITYQSLAVFDDDAATASSLLEQLHDNGQELVRQLRELQPLTVVLDECHHLLQTWGRLLDELLEELGEVDVLGLTATPASSLTQDEARLVDRLFGQTVYEASIPALVRSGELAPFAELAWLTAPTPTERDWLAEQSLRFTEIVTHLSDPTLGSVPLLEWLDRRWVHRPDVSWATLARQHPELCDAALRLHHAGLLAMPPGARLGEQHQRDPDDEDWLILIDDWVSGHLARSRDPRDESALDWLRTAAPSVGWRLSRGGLVHGVSLVDRVLGLSAAKADAVLELVACELSALGSQARVLVLCDTESMTATRSIHGVLAGDAGSATAVTRLLVERLGHVATVMVTGRTVAGASQTLTAVAAQTDRQVRIEPLDSAEGSPDPGVDPSHGGLSQLTGAWSTRDWVPAVTRAFEQGTPQVLVGTRALLGEGWDARSLTCVIDLTTATTSTAVVQTRGRALRLDPSDPEKVAITWSVTCIEPGHAGGDADWRRLVRKHSGFYSVDLDAAAVGEYDIVESVAHLDDSFSPYRPPDPDTWAPANARMLERAHNRALIREAWQVGTPAEDVGVVSVRIRQPVRRTRPTGVVLRPSGLYAPVTAQRQQPNRPLMFTTMGLIALYVPAMWLSDRWDPGIFVLLGIAALSVVAAIALVVDSEWGILRKPQQLRAASAPPGVDAFAYAVADTMAELGRSPVGAVGVHFALVDGEYRARLDGVDELTSAEFATCVDEVVSAVVEPRYVVPRWVYDPPRSWWRRFGALFRAVRPTGQVWHAVPTALSRRRQDANVFARHLDTWVGCGRPVYTGSPEGEGALVVARGQDPFAPTTVVRTAWR